jgi:hypothetical protein
MNAIRTIQHILKQTNELANLADSFKQMEERLRPGYLEKCFPHIHPKYFPKFSTQGYLFLALLSDKKAHGVWELLIWTGSTAGIRSALQLLTNSIDTNRNGYHWHIINDNDGTSKPASYRLSELHFSGCKLDDAKARVIAEKQYLKRRKEIAIEGVHNAPKVAEEIATFEHENPHIKVL